MSIARRSGELVLLPVLDPSAAAPFYEGLGFAVTSADHEEVVLEKPGMQLVLERVEQLERDDGRPRIQIMVDIDVLDAVWKHDGRDDPTLPGPTLSPDGVFEYRARDPSGNRIRITAPLPEPEL